MEDEYLDRNPLPQNTYQPKEGDIGKWDFNSIFNFDSSRNWGPQELNALWQKIQQEAAVATPEKLNEVQRIQEALVNNRQGRDPYESLQRYGQNFAPISQRFVG